MPVVRARVSRHSSSAKVFFTHEVRMRRQANPQLSSPGEFTLAQYEQILREQEDLTPASVRNYLSDVRQFIAWYEEYEAWQRSDGQNRGDFDPQAITTPTLTRY